MESEGRNPFRLNSINAKPADANCFGLCWHLSAFGGNLRTSASTSQNSDYSSTKGGGGGGRGGRGEKEEEGKYDEQN